MGHSLNGDLTAMRLIHPYVIDTSVAYNLRGFPGQKSKLRDLAYLLLGRKIQELNVKRKGHDALEDAEATMQLVLLKLRNDVGFGDLTAVENEGKWPRGLEDFVVWYDCAAQRQKMSRPELMTGAIENQMIANGSKESTVNHVFTNGSKESSPPSESGIPSASSDSSSSAVPSHSHIPLRDAFLQRTVATKRQTFRNLFDQLNIQKNRVGSVVDHEDVLEGLLGPSTAKAKPSNETRKAALTDKLIVDEAVDLIPNSFFVCSQLHRFRQSLTASAERRRRVLRKIDARIKRIYDALPAKAMIVVVFSGRKYSEAEERVAREKSEQRANMHHHFGLVFGGIKAK